MRYIRSLERKDIGLDSADDSAGLLHDEAERRGRDDAGRAGRSSRGCIRSCRSTRPRGTGRSSASSRRRSRRSPGLPAVSLQPNSGAQGEFTGLLVIQAYHEAMGHGRRTVALIPQSAHGTNPASATLAGLQVVIVACDEPRQHRRRRPAGEGRRTPRPAVLPDGDVSEHARRVRGPDSGDLRDRARAGRPGLHGRREHERAGRPHQSRPRSAPTCAT